MYELIVDQGEISEIRRGVPELRPLLARRPSLRPSEQTSLSHPPWICFPGDDKIGYIQTEHYNIVTP